MRRWALIIALVLGLASAAGSAGAGGRLQVVEAGNARFPDRSYLLTLPQGKSLTIGDLRVTENGGPVHAASLVAPAAADPKQFAVVLAVDASNSMRGAPIRGAMAAARALVAHRNPNQQVAVVVFNNGVRVQQPFTTDGAALSKTLAATPALAEGTRLYDAVGRSLDVLAAAKVKSGSIVLLTDGADVGSTTTADEARRRLRAAHVRAFTVGLASRAYDPAALQRLATASGGTYAEARSPDALTPIFDQLGSRLSREYLLSYRSLAGPGQRVKVSISAAGIPGAAVSEYVTPKLELTSLPPYRVPLFDRVIQSRLVMLLAALLVAGLFGWAIMRIATPRHGSVPARVGAFVSLGRPAPVPSEPAGRAGTSGAIFERTDRSLSKAEWWTRMRTTLEIAGIRRSPQQLILYTVCGTVLTAAVFALILGPFGILVGLCVPFAVRGWVLGKLARKRRAFTEQLPDNLEVLASALRAGHSLVGALAVVVESAAEPSRSEFRRVIAEEQLGVNLEDALAVTVERMESRDLDQVALVARLQRETGSNSAEVLDRVVESIRARMELRRLVHTLTAQGRLSRWILTGVPVLLALLLSLLNPGYLGPLFHHTAGRVLLVVATLMVVTGSLVIRRIVDIKV